MTWNKIKCNRRELQLLGTLNGGQSFRWEYNKETDEWTGVFSKTVWKLRQDDENLQYQIVGTLLNEKSKSSKQNGAQGVIFKNLLEKYFRLNVRLSDFYKTWSERDELFQSACKQFYGIRMLYQEPVENLFSFICSQNNHISRISTMVEKLCTHYGKEICEYDGRTYFSFPDVEKLTQPQTLYVRFTPTPEHPQEMLPLVSSQLRSRRQIYVVYADNSKIESELRDLGFGYRAKFIQKSAAQIVEWGGEQWFKGLQEMKYKDARLELMKLCGIGPKVADCICLMSLNHLEALPVDTHVYQIAAQNYLPHLKGKKNVTEKMYSEIGDHFRMLYGDMAGWAHTVLFCADLKKFQKNDDTSLSEEKPKKRRKK